MSKQVKFYREKAREKRDVARRPSEATLRDQLADVANEYDLLADKAEQAQS